MWSAEIKIHLNVTEATFYMTARSGVNENGLHSNIYLNVWFPVGGLFRKDLEVWPCWRRSVTEGGL